MKSPVIALDVGGTNIRSAAIDATGNILDEVRIEARLSKPDTSPEAVVSQLIAACKPLTGKHSATAIGIGFPGFFIGNSGVVAGSPNIPRLNNFSLSASLSSEIGLPVVAQNDALCAAIGEHRFGAGQGQSNLLHITLGTGIGGGLILNHRPYSGDGGMAMEFGHLRIDYSDTARVCGCGGKGCVETLASATAVIRSYSEAGGSAENAAVIFQRAESGDQVAIRVLEDAGAHLGTAIAEAVKLLDVHAITISGGLSNAWPILHPAIVQSMDYGLIPPLKGKIMVLQSTLSDNAGLLGAAALALDTR